MIRISARPLKWNHAYLLSWLALVVFGYLFFELIHPLATNSIIWLFFLILFAMLPLVGLLVCRVTMRDVALIVGAYSLLLGALFAVRNTDYEPRKPLARAFGRIQPGMTSSQVDAIFWQELGSAGWACHSYREGSAIRYSLSPTAEEMRNYDQVWVYVHNGEVTFTEYMTGD